MALPEEKFLFPGSLHNLRDSMVWIRKNNEESLSERCCRNTSTDSYAPHSCKENAELKSSSTGGPIIRIEICAPSADSCSLKSPCLL